MAGPEKRFREVPLGKPSVARAVPGERPAPLPADKSANPPPKVPAQKDEVGGPTGPEPTRYGDWEKDGRCTDF
ncbi:MAG: DUF1674 domain-containing protein [Proteobacteria bacterium]|nr:DUF1674 domain-containing protein [Pseudomonadota bacterium]MBI3497664.1 DUF1674 domain-containing protein [Pseudomonadota bacterium]